MFLKNKMDTDDVAQRVFVRVCKNLDKINLLSAKTWIMKTIHRLCIDFVLKRNIAMNREIIVENEEAHFTENKFLSPENKLQSN